MTAREEAIRLAREAGFHCNEYGIYSPYIEGSSLNVPIMKLIQLAKNEAFKEAAKVCAERPPRWTGDEYEECEAAILALVKE